MYCRGRRTGRKKDKHFGLIRQQFGCLFNRKKEHHEKKTPNQVNQPSGCSDFTRMTMGKVYCKAFSHLPTAGGGKLRDLIECSSSTLLRCFALLTAWQGPERAHQDIHLLARVLWHKSSHVLLHIYVIYVCPALTRADEPDSGAITSSLRQIVPPSHHPSTMPWRLRKGSP